MYLIWLSNSTKEFGVSCACIGVEGTAPGRYDSYRGSSRGWTGQLSRFSPFPISRHMRVNYHLVRRDEGRMQDKKKLDNMPLSLRIQDMSSISCGTFPVATSTLWLDPGRDEPGRASGSRLELRPQTLIGMVGRRMAHQARIIRLPVFCYWELMSRCANCPYS
ncbi:hypothetical protein BDP81DRAFT_203904 [Colletotrichum phormii]|uniref:Uncharacterized protein n=1 Tax=Colletotrichum phormii TaxID=359342 RepID=A0AAJ0EIR8_9PEZI|nr:uncharacterized protein BDP81DRAFT_203904 [Colletotrichum phormii]KAK1638215.1 hypothetical protein BDP81DRAFT_203904 [Colletotrichum phormii]